MVARLSRDYLQITPGLVTLRLSVALPPSAASVADEIEVIRPAGPITREHRRCFRIAAVGAYRDARSDVGESSNREENIALSARDARPRNGVRLRWSHLGMDPRGAPFRVDRRRPSRAGWIAITAPRDQNSRDDRVEHGTGHGHAAVR